LENLDKNNEQNITYYNSPLHKLHCTITTRHPQTPIQISAFYIRFRTLHSILHAPTHYTPHIPQYFTLHTLHFTFPNPHYPLYTLHSTIHTLHSHTSHTTIPISLYTPDPHTSHLTFHYFIIIYLNIVYLKYYI
jgi:hypothetical protein